MHFVYYLSIVCLFLSNKFCAYAGSHFLNRKSFYSFVNPVGMIHKLTNGQRKWPPPHHAELPSG